MATRLIAASLLTMTLSACAGDPLGELADKSLWRLVDLAGTPALADSEVTLEIDRTGTTLAGSTGCNRYWAGFSGDFQDPRVGAIGMTKRACVDQKKREQERRFVQALQSTTRIHAGSADRLLVDTEQGSLAFERFEKVER